MATDRLRAAAASCRRGALRRCRTPPGHTQAFGEPRAPRPLHAAALLLQEPTAARHRGPSGASSAPAPSPAAPRGPARGTARRQRAARSAFTRAAAPRSPPSRLGGTGRRWHPANPGGGRAGPGRAVPAGPAAAPAPPPRPRLTRRGGAGTHPVPPPRRLLIGQIEGRTLRPAPLLTYCRSIGPSDRECL